MSIYLETALMTFEELFGYVLFYLLIMKMQVRKKSWVVLYVLVTVLISLLYHRWIGEVAPATVPMIAGILFPCLGEKKK